MIAAKEKVKTLFIVIFRNNRDYFKTIYLPVSKKIKLFKISFQRTMVKTELTNREKRDWLSGKFA